MTEWHITIPTAPLGRTDPKSRAFINAHGKAVSTTYQPKKGVTKTFEAAVAMACDEVMRHVPVLDQPLVLDVLAVFDRPGYMLEPHQPGGLIFQANKPDRDNVEKAVQDGMKSLWSDDCRVALGQTVKAYRERDGKARVEVWLRTIEPAEALRFHGHEVVMPQEKPKRAAKAAKQAPGQGKL